MPLASECKPAVLPLSGGQSGATVRVHPILTGELHAPPAHTDRPTGRLAPLKIAGQLIGGRGRWQWLPIPAFLVEHPSAGAILIDTGLHPSCVNGVSANMGQLNRFIYEARMTGDQALREALPARGVNPSQVRIVIMTHLHVDHASAISEFPQATFIIDKREWAAASRGGTRQGYYSPQFDHPFDWRCVDFEADPVASFAGFAQSFDLLGDGSIRLVSTPGHTRGHQSVVLRTGSRELLVMGDAAYTLRELHGEAHPVVAADDHLRRRSLKEVRLYLEQSPEALAIPGHDVEFWPKLEPLYE
ncbi:MAG: N-acyl homoserine lactonase family protein [Solirubrobacterales bacterium]|nr:N-acyl homoserine lactonase family protein [Solirubrobacterales bacterium]